ncbi:MAG: hypothetical protein M3220_18710, partial [Chloroflexota bacterium]|nr:hypothetical protein [Chloroflexota bacterium]
TVSLSTVLVDVKPHRGGWYAHGLYALDQPPSLSGEAVVSCTASSLQMSGERFLVLAGRVAPVVARVEVLFDRALPKLAPIREGIFATATEDATGVREVQAFDNEGELVQRLTGDACNKG